MSAETYTEAARRLWSGMTLTMAGHVGGLLIGLGLTPYIVSRLGLAPFGAWAMTVGVVSYASALDFGLGGAFVRFFAACHARDERHLLGRLCAFGLLFYLGMGAVLGWPLYLAARWLLPALRMPTSVVAQLDPLLPFVVGLLFASLAVNVVRSLLMGVGGVGASAVIRVVARVAYAVAVVTLLAARGGLAALAWATGIELGVMLLGLVLLSRRLAGRLLGNPCRLPRTLYRQLFSFGGWMQVNAMSNLANNETDRVVIGAWVNVASAGVYELGNRLALLVRSFPLSLLPALVPEATALHETGNAERTGRILLQGNRLLTLLSLALGGWLIAVAPALVRLWLGHSYPTVATVACLLVGGYMVNNLTGTGTTLARAWSLPRIEAEYAAVGTLVNAVLTVLLVHLWGMYGVLVATIAGSLLGSLFFLFRFHRLPQAGTFRANWRWLPRVAGPAVGAVVVARGAGAFLPGVPGRADALVAVAVVSVVYTGTLAFFLRASRFVSSADVEALTGVFRGRTGKLLSRRVAAGLLVREAQQ